jgi:hypothetical protein
MSRITNSIDFVSHGTKSTAIGMLENLFSVTQTGSNSDSKNVSLSGYSLQSDMLTSAYFNAEVGDLREILAAYQIKLDKTNKKHRAIFIGGMNNRDGNSKTPVDVNAGNYPIDVNDDDTNNGKSWKQGLGIPNINLKGNTFNSSLPIYPLTKQNPNINSSSITDTVLSNFNNVSSFIDAIELIKNIFGLSTINYNINNVKYINGLGNSISTNDYITPNASNTYTPFNKNIYISLTSSVTQWIKLAGIKISINKNISTSNYPGLIDSNNNPIKLDYINGLSVKLIVDGFYYPRQLIGNGMSNQQLFVWTEGSVGDKSNHIININSILQFDLSNYLIASDISNTKNYNVTKEASNKIGIKFGNTNNDYDYDYDYNNDYDYDYSNDYDYDYDYDNKYIYIKKKGDTRGYFYQVISVEKSGSKTILTVNYSVKESGNYNIKIIDTISLYRCMRFNIDEIRDRYSMLQLISHLGRLYKSSTNMSIPLKLVQYLAQIKTNSSLNILLKYISLYELYTFSNSSTVDQGKKLNQIFHFIQNDNNYLSNIEGGDYGISLRHWNDEKDSVEINKNTRFTSLNTNLKQEYPIDWNTSSNKSPTGKIISLNTNRINKIKHVVITNLPGFVNGRYGTSMSSSNLINGFFGSLSIDLSYSDTHTPVDINGMNIHQWDINNTNIIDGINNPSRWNINADENYKKSVVQATINC